MADTEQQQHQIGLHDDNQSQGGESQGLGDATKGKESTTGADYEKKVAEERKDSAGEGPEATDEEMDKAEEKLHKIIDGALDSVKPWLKLMIEKCETAEEKIKKSEDFKEKEFIEEIKPVIRQAQEILEKCLNEVKAVDPEKKVQRRAQRNAEDDKASPRQRQIAEGLQKLSGEVQGAIDECKKKCKSLPNSTQTQLDKMFGMLSQPLFQILSAVGLLVYGVLNLLGQILDAIGLGGVLRGLMDGLGINSLLKNLGWKLQIVKTGN